jgi:transposase
MSADRYVVTERMWKLMEPHCLGKKTDPGRTGSDPRLFLEAVLWIARTDCPWRDLPPHFGKWNTVFKRFRDWVKADVFKQIFDALSGEPDMEYAMIDGTIIKVHRHGQGAKGGLKARLLASPEAG